MPMKSLQELRGLFKAPLLLHRWMIEIPIWPSACQPDNTDILFLVTTSSVPAVTDNEVNVSLGSFTMNFNGKQTRNGTISWSLPENTDLIVTKFFNKYARQRQNYNDSANLLVSSANDEDLLIPVIKMRLLDPSNSNYVATYELYNCYFNVGGGFTGDLGQDSEASTFSVTVAYDAFTFIPGS